MPFSGNTDLGQAMKIGKPLWTSLTRDYFFIFTYRNALYEFFCRYYIIAIIGIPVFFYAPKFFELRTYDVSTILEVKTRFTKNNSKKQKLFFRLIALNMSMESQVNHPSAINFNLGNFLLTERS